MSCVEPRRMASLFRIVMKRAKKLPLIRRIYIKSKFNMKKMMRPARKLLESYQKYLGRSIGTIFIPDAQIPTGFHFPMLLPSFHNWNNRRSFSEVRPDEVNYRS